MAFTNWSAFCLPCCCRNTAQYWYNCLDPSFVWLLGLTLFLSRLPVRKRAYSNHGKQLQVILQCIYFCVEKAEGYINESLHYMYLTIMTQTHLHSVHLVFNLKRRVNYLWTYTLDRTISNINIQNTHLDGFVFFFIHLY